VACSSNKVSITRLIQCGVLRLSSGLNCC